MTDPVLSVQSLEKTFRIGFFRKRVEAVRGVSFEVKQGEIFGLLGPNGAGKTTTIKMVLRLIFPDAGTVRVFGIEGVRRRAMERVGYMPENPYVYQYLKPLEFLDLCGQLVGLDASTRRKRSRELLGKVGLEHAAGRPIGKFSKGMMQRIGLAQALLHDPELLILDEPMSGLDPIGRKEVRDLLLEQRAKGKTLLFTSHILTDVETLCDQVVILKQGKITTSGAMNELLQQGVQGHEVELDGIDAALTESLHSLATPAAAGERGVGAGAIQVRVVDKHATVHADDPASLHAVLQFAMEKRLQIRSVSPTRRSLENLFVEGGRG